MSRPAHTLPRRALFGAVTLAALAAIAVGLLARAAERLIGAYETQRLDYAIVRVLAPEGEGALAAAERVLEGARGVRAAAPMSAARASALLEQWGGAPVSAADLPPLRLIEVELAPAAPADIARTLSLALDRAGLTAEVLRAPDGAGLGPWAARARQAALWGAGAFALIMALIVWQAGRALAGQQRDLMNVLADLGETRAQAAARVADRAMGVGFRAGLLAAALAGAAGLALLYLLAPAGNLEALLALIGPLDLAPLAAAPLAAATAAAMGARAGAESDYARAARLG